MRQTQSSIARSGSSSVSAYAGSRRARPFLAAFLCVIALAAVQPAAAQVDDSYHPPAGGGGGGFDDQIRRQGGVASGASCGCTSVQRPRRAGRSARRGQWRRAGGGGEGLRGTQRQGTVAPIPIAIPAFLGDDPKLSADISQRRRDPISRGRACFSRSTRPPIWRIFATSMRCRASPIGARSAPKLWRSDASAGGRRAPYRRIPFVGRGDRQAAGRPAVLDWRAELATCRPYGRRPDLRAADGRKGLFRHARRVRRRDGPEGQAHQAARHHGSGRRQRAAAVRRARSWC